MVYHFGLLLAETGKKQKRSVGTQAVKQAEKKNDVK